MKKASRFGALQSKKTELLAPAGTFEMLKAVIHAGADAVYAGGSRFGARAYAGNFTQEALLAAIDYVHLHGRKIFLTVNTLFKQSEIDDLYEYLLPYYRQGLDAVIVQDFGVLRFVRACFPDLAVHASTQMSITGAYGAAYLKSFGVRRIVAARELSLAEIRALKSSVDIALECFVHGALCYCYSGQCLFSSMLGGRSGNRGRCAQPCRLPYTVLDADGRAISMPECYPLSLKDLCTIELLPQLIEAGIDSFKIEGRMKSPEYAAGVTAIYRRYLDRYFSGDFGNVQKADLLRLADTGSRSGFTSGYYVRRNGADMVTMARPCYEKGEAAYLDEVRARFVQKEQKLPVRANVRLNIGEPAELTVTCRDVTVSVRHGITQEAKKQPLSRETVAAQLSKTGNTPFVISSMEIVMEEAVFLPKQQLNELRREALEQLAKKIPEKYYRNGQTAGYETAFLHKKKETPYFAASIEASAQLSAVLAHDFITRVYLDGAMYTHGDFAAQLKEHVARSKDSKKQAYVALPFVFRLETARFYEKQMAAMEGAGVDGYLARSMDALGFLRDMQVDMQRCVLDYGLYAYSDSAKAAYAAAGWLWDTVPPELNKKELLARDNQASELLIYGHLPLMTGAQCLLKTLGRCTKNRANIQDVCYLKDRYAKKFPVRSRCSECYHTIYNAQPLSLIQLSGELGNIRPAGYRLSFTFETREQADNILGICQKSFFTRQKPDMAGLPGDYTNGHYKRGVE